MDNLNTKQPNAIVVQARMEHEVKCQSCGEKEATYHIKIPDYAGNAAPLRCDECMKVAVKSHEGVVVEKIEE